MHFKIAFVFLLLLFSAPRLCAQARIVFAKDNSLTVTDRNFNPLRNILSGKDALLITADLQEVSPWFILALLAAEDKRFFEHNGIDVKATARALWQNVSSGKVVSGASTITQQLANSLEPKERTLKGKLKEAHLAAALEKQYTKEEILEAYLNTVNFGGNIYGVQTAAFVYFDTNAENLSVSQSAFLAGLIKSPSHYNPVKNLPAALKRRDTVLKRMLDNGYINQEIYNLALEEKIKISPQNKRFSAPHYGLFIASKAKDKKTALIQSTIDGKIQAYIEDILPGYIKNLSANRVSNAAAVVLDNATGEVLALAGSADYFDIQNSGQVNGALALRQPGSALKPFVYGAAFEEGFLPSDKVEDSDKFFSGNFRPKNYDEQYHGTPSIREALACSYNIPAVQVAGKLGTYKILLLLKNLGFSSLNKRADFYGLGIALGNGEVTLLELANAYRTLANNGIYSPMVYALNPLIKQEGASKRVLSVQSAAMITDILSDNNARSAAFGLNSPLNLPYDFAAKTGTSKDYKDNWAAGYSRRFTVAVWVGNFDGAPMRRISGITGAAPIMHDIALFLEENYPSSSVKGESSFNLPSSLVYSDICPVSGKLVHRGCSGRIREIFPIEKQPKEYCSLNSTEHKEGASAVIGTGEGILFPLSGDVFMQSPYLDKQTQQIKFRASESGYWYLNGEKLSCGKTKECFWPSRSGKFILRFESRSKTYTTRFEVLK